MVVFHDDDQRAALADALCERGLEVWEVATARQALQLMEEHPVAVMIIQSSLPLTSGFDLARQVRSQGGLGADTALIVITDVAWPRERKAATMQQMDLLALINQPVVPGQVAEVALRAVDLPGSGDQSRELRGTLGAMPFARLLGELHGRAATGALLLHGPSKKIVYLRDGHPVYVRSNQQQERLGEVLVREGVITRAQRDESLRRMERQGRQQGAILLEMGAIDGRGLVIALESQLRTKLLEIFTWDRGDFFFRGAPDIPTEEIRLDWTPAEVIAHGVRRAYNESRLEAALEPFINYPLALTLHPRLRFQELTLDAEEQSLLELVDGARTLAQVLAHSLMPRQKALATAFILLACGLVEREGTRFSSKG